MAINLTKGQRIDLGLKKVRIVLGWKPNIGTGFDFDLDASAFMLGSDGQIPAERFFVFYNNQRSVDDSVESSGDDLTGDDGESLTVDLERVDPRIEEIIFTVTIHEADTRRQNFGQVHNSFISLYNVEDPNREVEVARYDLDEDFSIETAVEFGRLYRRNGSWRFEAMGRGVHGGLQELVNRYARLFA